MVSARARILGWILLIVTLAAVVIVGATGRAMYVRVDAQANAELAHEAEKFREFAARPDPATGAPFTTATDLLTSHLQHNLPEQDETFFSIVDAEPSRRSAGSPPARLDRDEQFVAQASRADQPIAGRWETSAGPVSYAVIPVQVAGDPARGHLVVVEFLTEGLNAARTLMWTMSIIATIALAGAAVTGWFVTGRVLAPIRRVRETAAAISDTDLDRRIEVVGTDDVAQLARTFNHMLDRLASAFEGQRQFLDDAGHELRTPLTIIRGHLELMGAETPEQEHTLALVSDELHRMGRLVDDLILLARSERPDFIRPAPTDLTDLVVETFTKATGLAERRWMLDETPAAGAEVDAERITQALLQLAANAVAHTRDGERIAFGGRVDDRIRLWVRDEGRGIDPADQERIFQRFVRADPTKSRERNSGLGLAIVSRIAAGHGGEVALESAPGRGSTFTLILPLREGP